MRRLVSFLLVILLSFAVVPALAGSADPETGALESIGGPVLLADYPDNEFTRSFDGKAYDWYREVYSYEDVGVVVTNERQSRFTGGVDEILAVSEAYGTITSVKLVEMDPLEGADLTVRLRFEVKAPKGFEGPKKWIVDLVKVYQPNYVFMFTVARDAKGKDYGKKVNKLIRSLRLGDASEAAEAAEGNFFADEEDGTQAEDKPKTEEELVAEAMDGDGAPEEPAEETPSGE